MAEHYRPLDTIMAEDILLFNLLPRLPVKCILRFMCVCKGWHSFLRTPVFAKMHLHHVTNDDNQNHDKLLVLFFSTRTRRPRKFCNIDCEIPKDGLTGRRSLPFKVRRRHNMETILSLHGMVLVGITNNRSERTEYCDLILWNPVTADYKTLSKPTPHKECYEANEHPFGLYYSSSDDDYRLVRLTNYPTAYYIYSLKADSWRKVRGKVESRENFIGRTSGWIQYGSACVLLDEKLYFLRIVYDYGENRSCHIITRFESKTEELRKIETPRFINRRAECICLMVLEGRIHLCAAVTDSVSGWDPSWMELWRMDGHGDWMKVVSYDSLWIRMPLHIMRNGNWLTYGTQGHIYQRDMKRKNTKDIICLNKLLEISRWKYMETMVSPNLYIHDHSLLT